MKYIRLGITREQMEPLMPTGVRNALADGVIEDMEYDATRRLLNIIIRVSDDCKVGLEVGDGQQIPLILLESEEFTPKDR